MTARPQVSPQEYKSVTALDGPKRYSYFVKKVADWETVWSLWDDGWVAASDDAGMGLLPLWPAKEYAEPLAVDDWSSAEARELPIDDCIELLRRIEENGMKAAVFMTHADKGVVRPAADLIAALEAEEDHY